MERVNRFIRSRNFAVAVVGLTVLTSLALCASLAIEDPYAGFAGLILLFTGHTLSKSVRELL